MSYENRRPDVAVFIDFENVYVSVRDKLDANPNFESIMDRCNDLGRVVIARAYADWYRYPRVTSALYANGIEPMYVPTYYYDKEMGRTGRAIKNSVDMNLCIDAMKTLFVHTNIAKFVLVTGDRDFIPLVNSIRQQGKEVVIIGIGGAASTHLAQSADEFVFYEQLVGKAVAPVAAERPRPRDAGMTPVVAPEGEVAEPAPLPTPEVDVYTVLVEAVHLVRKRGYVSTLGSLKLVMKELMGGDFKESRYKDLNNRPFTKFKDFVLDAEKRGKVQIFTSGTVNEVFLPGEDPYKLSQFAADLKEEGAVEPALDLSVLNNGRKEQPRAPAAADLVPPPAPTGRRRRRRSRGQRSTASSAMEELPLELGELAEISGSLEEEPLFPDELPEDELVALDELEPQAEIVVLSEEELPEDFATAELPLDYEDFAPIIVDEAIAPPADIVHEPVAVSEPELTAEASVAIEPETIAVPETEPVAVAEPAVFVEPEAVVEPQVDEPVAIAAPEAPVVAEAEPAAVAEDVTEAGEDAETDSEEQIAFSDEEWDAFQTLMAGFTKPVSFAQIFDSLRDLRKQQNISRTNEQLRTLVKQAINNGKLERSGRGKRIYYKLKDEE